MNKSLVITKYKNRLVSYALDGRQLQYMDVSEDAESILGNIYIGKVKNVVPSINSCFVEYQKDCLCYLPLNSVSSGNILSGKREIPVAGDEIIIQITADSKGVKNPTATGKIKINNRKVKLDESNDFYNVSRQLVCFSLVKKADPDYIDFSKKCISKNFTSIFTDDSDVYQTLLSALELKEEIVYKDGTTTNADTSLNSLTLIKPRKSELVASNADSSITLRFYNDESFSLSSLYGLNAIMDEILNKKVWLKSGGYLIIEPTEALISIDVNSGKDIGKKFTSENILRINKEAAIEAARQIRLRNYSGIIIVDFINMKNEDDKIILIDTINKALSEDMIKAEFIDITSLGLGEITRKRVKSPINMHFFS